MPDDTPPVSPVSSSEPVAPVTTGLTPNVAAGLAAIFILLGGIVLLVIEKRDQFVRFWAMQSVFFGVAWFVFGVAAAIVGMVLSSIFSPLGWLWNVASGVAELGFVVVWIISILQAFSGKEWEIPVIGKLARQQLGKPPALL